MVILSNYFIKCYFIETFSSTFVQAWCGSKLFTLTYTTRHLYTHTHKFKYTVSHTVETIFFYGWSSTTSC